MILRITQYGEPILRKVGEPITQFDEALAELADKMDKRDLQRTQPRIKKIKRASRDFLKGK